MMAEQQQKECKGISSSTLFSFKRMQLDKAEVLGSGAHGIVCKEKCDSLLSVATDCLNDKDTECPSAQQLCEHNKSALKGAPEYYREGKNVSLLGTPETSNRDSHSKHPSEVDDIQSNHSLPEAGLAVNNDIRKELVANVEDGDTCITELSWRTSEQTMVEWDSITNDDNVIYYQYYKKIYSHNRSNNKWSELPDSPHSYCSLVVIDHKLTTIGGYEGLTNKLFSLSNMSWNERFPSMPTKRQQASALCTGTYLIVAGGMGECFSVLDVVEVLNLDNHQWSTAAKLLEPMYDASIVICHNCVLILGGNDKEWHPTIKSVGVCTLSSLLSSCNPERKTHQTSPTLPRRSVWSTVADIPVTKSTGVSLHGQPLAVGGVLTNEFTTVVASVYLFEPITNSWKIISEMNIPRYRCFATVLSNNQLIVAGGFSENQTQVDVVEIATLVVP